MDFYHTLPGNEVGLFYSPRAHTGLYFTHLVKSSKISRSTKHRSVYRELSQHVSLIQNTPTFRLMMWLILTKLNLHHSKANGLVIQLWHATLALNKSVARSDSLPHSCSAETAKTDVYWLKSDLTHSSRTKNRHELSSSLPVEMRSSSRPGVPTTISTWQETTRELVDQPAVECTAKCFIV